MAARVLAPLPPLRSQRLPHCSHRSVVLAPYGHARQPCRTFQALRRPVSLRLGLIQVACKTVAEEMVLRCVGGADRDVAELATGISPPDGSGTGGILEKDVALLIPSIEKSRCIPSQAEPTLWSEDASYPQPRRVIHNYPQSIIYPRLSIPFGKRDGHMPARLKTKEDPPKRAFLAEKL